MIGDSPIGMTDVITCKEDSNKIDDIWNMLGLDPNDAIKIGNGKYTSSKLDVDVTDNGDGSYTLDRN